MDTTTTDLPTMNQRRLDLVALLGEISNDLSSQDVWGAGLSDVAFERKRAALIAQRTNVEQELIELKARIKAANIAAAAEAKRLADERKAAGQSENVANLQRAAKVGNVRPSEVEHAKARAPAVGAAPRPGLATETHGQSILRMAKNLRRSVGKVRVPLPYNAPLLIVLDDFIENQKKHLADLAAKGVPAKDAMTHDVTRSTSPFEPSAPPAP